MKIPSNLSTNIPAILFFVFSTAGMVMAKTSGDLAKENNCAQISVNTTMTARTNCAKAGALEISSYISFGLTILSVIAFTFFACRSGNKSQQTSIADNRNTLHYGTTEQRDEAAEKTASLVANTAFQNA